uniref:BTB_2 domain-containing protein n=1 Tax=Rhabditophanes sp. KR3021 TaxID=114890 RepID=A0AC35TPJ8_9BILA
MKAAKEEKDCLRMTIFGNGNVIGSIHPKILCNECYFVRKELEERKVPCSILTMDAQPAATCDKVLDYLVSGVIKFKFSEVREIFELCHFQESLFI